MVTRTVLIVFLLLPITLGAISPALAQSGGESPSGSLALPPPLFAPVPVIDFKDDKLLTQFNQGVSFGWNLKIFGEDIAELFTFDPTRLAELKLKHAEERQKEINALEFIGSPIPVEYEERRIMKLNEAREIVSSEIQDNPSVADSRLTNIINSFNTLRSMGELNDIRVLYSQLPRIMESSDEVKERYNAKVNSLQTWHDFCHGEFDVETLGTMRTAVDRIEDQCPELVVLQERFGTDRLHKLVKGTI